MKPTIDLKIMFWRERGRVQDEVTCVQPAMRTNI